MNHPQSQAIRYVRSRARKQPDYLHAQIVEPALEEWIAWLIQERFPKGVQSIAAAIADLATHEADTTGRVQGRNDEHSDPTMEDAIAAQRRHTWQTQQVNRFWTDLPKDQKTAVLAERLDMSQVQIGLMIGLRQQLISTLLTNGKVTIGLRLLASKRDIGGKFFVEQAVPS